MTADDTRAHTRRSAVKVIVVETLTMLVLFALQQAFTH